jgi:hypothetical protein
MFFKAAAAALVFIAATSGSTTLRDSVLTFRQALAACPGALGSVSFAVNHARVAAAEGIDSDESETNEYGQLTVVLQDPNSGKSAKIDLDQRTRTVTAKNLRVESGGKVACILPD